MFAFFFVIIYALAFSQFVEVKTYPDKCIYPRLAHFADSKISNGTFNECKLVCEYDNNCNFFSHYANNCLMSTKMELTDNYNASKLYFSRNTTTFMKNGFELRYYSQLCVNYFNKRSCHTNKQCAWRKGIIPYNIETYTSNNGFCGRIRCGS